jgi:hypothetical protein
MLGKDNNEKGRMLEDILLDRIKATKYFDHVFTESQLIKYHGFKASSIDFMLMKGNKIIFIQCKYRLSRRRENQGIEKFLNSVNFLKDIYGPSHLYMGLWSSRREPFEDNKTLMIGHKVYSISKDAMLDLVQETISLINQLMD